MSVLIGGKTTIYSLRTGRHVVCYLDPASGKRIRRKFKNLSDAKVHKKDLELKYQVRGPHAFISEPVARLMSLHLEKFPNSRVRERKNAFISFCNTFGHRKISEVGKSELASWFKTFQEENDLSERTLSTVKSNINAFFKFLKDEGLVEQSPLLDIKFKRNPPMRRPRIVLSVEEVKYLLESAEKFSPNHLYPFLYTVANTGARRSEILELRRDDVDFKTGLIHLRQTKNGEDRSIRMSDKLRKLLEAQMSRHDSHFVFPSPEGRRYGRTQIQRAMKQFKKHFPIGKDWGLHSLRHSFAYNFLKKGGEMYQLQAILGHKHIQVTVDLYGQLQAQDVENISPYES